MTLRKKKTPRASQHYLGWRAGQKSLLLPVAGESFLLTLPFIERGYRTSGISAKSTCPVIRLTGSYGTLCGVEHNRVETIVNDLLAIRKATRRKVSYAGRRGRVYVSKYDYDVTGRRADF